MKVPTFQKYGLTKAGVEKSELRDKKISDILTHHLTIGIGIVFGILIYILNYSKVRPSTFIQIVMQVFLFASMGVLCVGIPAVLFKFAEMFYFKYFRSKTEEKKNIQKYFEEKEEFDFWKIRKDYSFWKVLDGLSFEREILNIYTYLDFTINDNTMSINAANDKILTKDNSNTYISFKTGKEITDTEIINSLIDLKNKNNCEDAILFIQQGINKKALDYAKEKNVQVNDINGIIKVVKSVPVK